MNRLPAMPYRISLLFIPLLACAASARAQNSSIAQLDAFTKTHCYDCHAGADAEAGLDLTTLPTELDNPAAMTKWVRIFDRVKSGEMPPPDGSELTATNRDRFITTTGKWIRQHQRKDHKINGRVNARRLTNLQLERTLHDLLGIDIPLSRELPDEPRTDGFTTVADGQPMSHFQLESHLGIVDLALDEAFRRAASREVHEVQQLSARTLARRNARRRTREPEMLNGHAVVWSTNTTYYGRLPSTEAQADGWFRFTIRASALNKPQDRGIWCSVRSGRCVSSAPLLEYVSGFELSNKPTEWTFDAWLPEGHMLEIRPTDATLKRARFQGGQIGTGEGEPQEVPGLATHSMTMQRIHYGPTSAELRRELFAGVQVRREGDRKRGFSVAIKSQQPRKDIARLVNTFARRAFRRPVADDAIKPFTAMALESFDAGESLADSIRAGYRAVLCSPRFLYLNESAGQLDDYALASRLSYFLWNTMPDKPLLKLAAAGQLHDATVQRQQVNRMLDHPRGQTFVKDFAHEWLDLSEIDFTQPDRRRHRDFDIVVQQSMLAETHTFLQTMLSENLSVTNLIDSDFTFLNSRLAAFYGIEGVKGDALRKVRLKPEHRRGGVLTHGSILKVTANGSTTSPVTRGVWVAERLLGQHIPPPPDGIPAIEPDIRGAKTIREMLAKHRSDASCASCHVKIDPPGFALENFDPSGKWRITYFNRNRRKRLKVDPSYTLADGRRFADVDEFQKLIVNKPWGIARNVAEKLVTYGTGGPVTFADRKFISDIVKQTADSNYGFRSLVHAVVSSPTFQNK